MMPHSTIKDASIADYRAGGRSAGEQFLAEMLGYRGVDKWLTANKPDAVKNALNKAGQEMSESGATEQALEAWSEGFAEPLNAHCDRMDREAMLDRSMRRN